ncbi:MAG: glycosyltransferase family 9 protein [Cytophagales bacterium]|nr:glycosyltransferase family 9 protein [Cytophagales bacterium]
MKSSPVVLIIQTAFIGDVILATSLIESIRAEAPSATIDFVVRKGNEELLAGNPGLRRVLVLDKSRKYRQVMELIKDFRRSRYDYVINVQRYATTGLMTALSGGRYTIGFASNPLSLFFTKRVEHDVGGVHEITRNLRLLAPLGIEKIVGPRIYPSEKQWERVREFKTKPYLTISPASVWFTKQWPAERWVELVKGAERMNVFLLGGPGDKDHCERISVQLPEHPVVNLCGQLSLVESAALMKDAHMNFVNDSAPLHLASAMNAPVAAVFCSTVPEFGFGPLSEMSFVIQTEEKLQCRPCGLHGFKACPQGHFRCASGIGVDRLLRTLA